MLTIPSSLERLRRNFRPQVPTLLKEPGSLDFFKEELLPRPKSEEIKTHFPRTFGQPFLSAQFTTSRKKNSPLRIGALFSGGQASGGHNVLAGLFDALHLLHRDSKLIGFLGGPSGVLEGKHQELTKELLDPYRNMGGFDLIGSGRTKIETLEQLEAARKVVEGLDLDGLVIIGGDDSNTNAAFLAEYFLSKNCRTRVVGVPKTIDGDLKNAYVEISFGFDTATKVYSELIGNIARDAASAAKYYHFIKLMGRTASHITLECALATHPNLAIISEECAEKNKTLHQIVEEIADLICKRAAVNKNFGVILVPEGLLEFLPEIKTLIGEGASQNNKLFSELPESIQKQLLLERDPHGNVQVSLIETELLLIELVTKELNDRSKKGDYQGKFAAQSHFFGYEGRAAFPSNFDANYCQALGFSAALLLAHGYTGYMAVVLNLDASVEKWEVGGVPLTHLMHMEMRKGKSKPVVQKALVDLKGSAFMHFAQARERWATDDLYRFPGPIQFFGDPSVTDTLPLTMTL
ncbi:MAG: diphosphate--fructose-6-phosphate 1-phosphotransferase [Chlamydiales bacterium]